MENKASSIKTIDIVQIGLMAAITYIATYLYIYLFIAVIHIGDSMVYLSAILLGRKKSAISSAVGMTIFDLITGYTSGHRLHWL